MFRNRGLPQFTWHAFLWLAVAISIPIFAICIFLYVSLEELGDETAHLARFYGMFLFKEQISHLLVTMAKGLEPFQREEPYPIDRGERVSCLEQILQSARCAGLYEHLIVVDRKAATVLYPSYWQKGRLEFLEDPAKRAEFFRIIQGAGPETPVQGYFSVDTPDGNVGSHGMWYVAAVPVGQDFLLIALVSEGDIHIAGNTMQAAQQELIKKRGRGLLFYVLPAGLASALIIGYLFCSMGTNRNDNKERRVT
jgi:hypothetical protein